MENKCKRFLSLLLAFVMVLGMFPAGHAHAEEAKSFDTIKIDPRTIEGSASCWSADGTNANPDDAFDGTIDGKGTNGSYWHSNENDTSKMENGEVYLIGELSQKSKVTKLVYHRRGAARDGNNENGLFNGRVTSCTIYATEGDVTRSNYVTQNNAELNWVEVAKFTNLENTTANELVFSAPVAAKAVKMVVHTTTNHANNNRIVTCGELEIFKAVCANDAHSYDGCEDTECNDCYATRVAPGHSFTNYESNGDATCAVDGTETATCDNCTATDTRTVAGSATGKHSFTNYESNGDATCAVDGTETATCDNCTATDTREVQGTQKVAVAEIDGTQFETLQAAFDAAEDGDEIVLVANVVLDTYLNVTTDGEIALVLYGNAITREDGTGIYVNNEDTVLTIYGDGFVEATQAVWANAGKVIIDGGDYRGIADTIYTTGTGHIEILGGEFCSGKTDHTADQYAVLNQKDNARDTSSIVVYGGIFTGFNPDNNASEGTGTNFVAEGYCSRGEDGIWTVYNEHAYGVGVYTAPTFDADGYTTYTCSECGDTYTETDEGSMKVAVAEIGETKYETLQAAFNAAKSDDRIELVANVELDAYLNVTTAGNIILDLNTYAITRECTGIYVNNAETILYIVGAGSVSATQAVWANAGTVAIYDGNFHGIADTIYTTGNGHIKIYDGKFSSEETDHTADQYAVLNQKDDARKTSSIVVYGGTFVGFNPANNASEGANTNFVAEGYCAAENNGVYTVQAHTAGTSVKENEKAATCTTDGSYDEVVYCSNCDKELSRVTSTVKSQGHTAGTPVKENETAAGYDLVTRCTVCNAVMSTQHVDTLADKVIMKSINVHLEAEIQFAYSVIIPDELVNAGATVVLTKPGVKTVVKEFTGSTLLKCQSKDDEGNIFYVVKMGIPSGEMTVPVTLEVRDAEGNALTICTSGGEELGTSQAFAVVDYAKLVLNGNYDAKTKELVKAMIVYGGYAQTEFKTFTDKLAYNEVGIDADLSSVTVDTLNQDQYKSSQSNNNMGVKANGLKVFLDSDIYLRVFMTVEDDISNYTFKLTSEHGVVNKIVEPVRGSDGRYYIDITGIASAYLDEVYMITVTNTVTGATNEITASAMSYARTVLMGNYPESLKNVVKAMYLYNQAANAKWPGR